MNNISLLIDGKVRTTLPEFIEANSKDGVCMIDPEDVSTLEHLEYEETHHIPCGGHWCHVKRVGDRPDQDHDDVQDEFDLVSTSEENYIDSFENPEW